MMIVKKNKKKMKMNKIIKWILKRTIRMICQLKKKIKKRCNKKIMNKMSKKFKLKKMKISDSLFKRLKSITEGKNFRKLIADICRVCTKRSRVLSKSIMIPFLILSGGIYLSLIQLEDTIFPLIKFIYRFQEARILLL